MQHATPAQLLQHLLEQTQGAPCPGVPEFLQAIRNLPAPPLVGLLTGNIRLGAEIKLRHYDLWDWFTTGGFGDDHEDRNQLAKIAQRRGEVLLNGRPLPGEEILVIGDTPLDVQCAQAIGAHMLAVGTGGYSCGELQACNPHWVVENLGHLKPKDICAVCNGDPNAR